MTEADPADAVSRAPEMTTGEPEAAAAPRADGSAATAPLTRAVIAAVGSRILIFAAAFFAVGLIGYQKLTIGWRFPARAEVFHGALGHLLNPWAHWDGVWFIKIATTGYADGDGSTAFFPLYPMLLRWLGVLFRGNFVTTGIVISLVCYAGCVWLLYRLAKEDFDDGVASRAVIYLAIGPLSFFLQAVYTESLFLFLSLACFVCAREGRWRLAGFAGLLATLTRSTGVLLLIPMFYYYYEDKEWDLKRTDSHAANMLMVVEGLLVWMTYLAVAFGKPLLFSTAQASWSRFLAAPNYTVGMAFFETALGVYRLLAAEFARVFGTWALTSEELGDAASNLVNLAFFVPAVGLLWYGARRLPKAYSWYALAALAYPLFFPSSGVPLLSYPRFTLTVFPLYIGLAVFTRGRPKTHVAVVIIGIVTLVLLTAKFAVFSWVA